MLKLPMQASVVSFFIFTTIPISVALFDPEVQFWCWRRLVLTLEPQIQTTSDQLEPRFVEKLGPGVALEFDKGL